MRERGYNFDYKDLDDRNILLTSAKDDAELYLVGLSKMLRRVSESEGDAEDLVGRLRRQLKRQRVEGPSLRIGPIPSRYSPGTIFRQVFEEITTWMKDMEGYSFLSTTRCIGWVDKLPDWLEVASQNVEEFGKLWEKRPDYLKDVLCMKDLY